MLNPLIPRLRESPWTAAFLDAINVSAVALVAELAVGTLTTWPAWAIAALSAAGALVFQFNAAWLVVGGAALGWLLLQLG